LEPIWAGIAEDMPFWIRK